MPSHFIVQITENGGPDPAQELQGLLNQSQISISQHVAWFKSTLTDNQFELSGRSICIIFRRLSNTDAIEAIVARVLTRNGFPAPDTIVDFYQNYQNLVQFWRLGGQRTEKDFPDLVRTRFQNLDEIPGVSVSRGLRASETFDFQASMAFWEFPDDQFNPLNWLQSLHDHFMIPQIENPSPIIHDGIEDRAIQNDFDSDGTTLGTQYTKSQAGEIQMDIFQAVLEFHQKFNIPIASKPEMLNKERFEFRCQLHYEEQKELEAAFEDSDLVKIADELGDLLFVIAGTCIEFGLPMGEILNAISEANLRKQPSELKPVEGKDWVGPEEAIRNALGSMLS